MLRYLIANRIDIEHLTAPLKVFEGNGPRRRTPSFPANVNVAAALSLAGISARTGPPGFRSGPILRSSATRTPSGLKPIRLV